MDVQKRSWSGQAHRSEETQAINFFLQPANLEKIASGVNRNSFRQMAHAFGRMG